MASGHPTPQSLARTLIHIIFPTKHREAWLAGSLQPRAFASLATIDRDQGCEVYRVGGVDHDDRYVWE